MILFVILALILASTIAEEDHLPEVSCLNELPLDRLLNIKRAFNLENWGEGEMIDDTRDAICEDSCKGPQAQALIMSSGGSSFIRRGGGGGGGGHGGGGGWSMGGGKSSSKSKSKSKMVSKLFQGTVTALSFLAFGGYLLCIIIRACRQRAPDVNMMMNGGAPAAPAEGGRLKKRDLDEIFYQNDHRWPTASWESLYVSLMTISEAYAAYYQVPKS